MKKIMHVIKIGLGIAMVMAAAYSLSSFGGGLDLILGALLMLTGIILGMLLERHRRRLFYLFSLPCFLLTLSLYFLPLLPHLQYLIGGFLIYFACAMAFGGKKLVIS